MEIDKKVLEWIVSGNVGLSSLTLFSLFCDIPIQHVHNYPSDSGDFERCRKFLALLDKKDKKRVLDQAEKISPKWAALVRNWELLEYLHSNELFYTMRKILEKKK